MKSLRKLLIISLIVFTVILGSSYLYRIINSDNSTKVEGINQGSLREFTLKDLSRYDGSVKGAPIYIGMNGYVYDVSKGSKYYSKGGVYHYLAGKDSSPELNLIGGDIIRKKYPVVGILILN